MDTTRPAEGNVFVLRTCDKDGKSFGGFQWPREGEVCATDWKQTAECGNGLHGLARGVGDGGHLYSDDDALWLVVEVAEESLIDLSGKVKFPRGTVRYCGERETATRIIKHAHPDAAVCYATVTGGDFATVTGGDGANVSGGYRATVSGGDFATVSGGYRATVTGGEGATVSGGDFATVSGGDFATVTGGEGATVTGSEGATVSGGDFATVTGGDFATVSGGDFATVSGGVGAMLTLCYYDKRKRARVFYVGEDGIKPNTPYKLDKNNNPMEVLDNGKA